MRAWRWRNVSAACAPGVNLPTSGLMETAVGVFENRIELTCGKRRFADVLVECRLAFQRFAFLALRIDDTNALTIFADAKLDRGRQV